MHLSVCAVVTVKLNCYALSVVREVWVAIYVGI